MGGDGMARLEVRAGEGWVAWLHDLADWCQVPIATVVDQALRRYAEQVTFHRPAPARVRRRRSRNRNDQIRLEQDQFHGTGAFQPDVTTDAGPLPELPFGEA